MMAVSSSHGQAGSGHLSSKLLEKLALDILSCLLQLLELRDLPVTTEQWTQSVTLCCLLYSPLKQQVVQQAAKSTLPQVLTLLIKDNPKLAISTCEDLLICMLGNTTKTQQSLHGAFAQCRAGGKDSAEPPPVSLSIELMTTLLREQPSIFQSVGQKTLGVVVQVLQKLTHTPYANPLEFVRVLQFVLVILQTQAVGWPTECRELILRVVQPIPAATEALRHQADFEDGYIYKQPQKVATPTFEVLKSLPTTSLWKAGLCMETLKQISHDESLKHIWIHSDTLLPLVEAISDFCTIGASCQDHMELLVVACRQNRGLLYPAESLATSSSSLDWWHQGKDRDEQYILGDTLWIGLGTILKMMDPLLEKSAFEEAFAPSLSVLQHYLKRFPASGTIVKRSLEGYFAMANVALKAGPLLRHALLTSLCKLSMPQLGTQDASCLLRDHNVAALICLLNIIHRHYNDIDSEWQIVLQTFQELSVLAIASPHLSDNAYVGALSISAIYGRFASFSTCLSDESLAHFVEGLKEIARLEHPIGGISSAGATDNRRKYSDDRLLPQSSSNDDKESIGEKIMSIGVRAIYGNSDGSDADAGEDVPLAERTKNTYYHDYQMEFARRLASSKHPIRVEQLPFSIALLADIAMTNSFRYKRCGSIISQQLCNVAAVSLSTKLFAMDIIAMLFMSHIAQDDSFPTSFTGPGRIMHEDPRQNQYLAVEERKEEREVEENISQAELLAPLCDCIRTVEVADVTEAGLEALHSVLESSGHKLSGDVWAILINAVASLSSSNRSSSNWSNGCLVAFRCLKLIVEDFLDSTDSSASARTSLLDCCSSFGSSRHDVNTSLTAIGLLWKIADQDAGNDTVDVRLMLRLNGSVRI
jgi:hypothetical protein